MDRRSFLGTCAKCSLALGAAPLLGRMGLPGLTSPAFGAVGNVSNVPARYFKQLENQEIKCLLCPRHCQIRPGERGLCGVRENVDGVYVTKVYGKAAAIHGDPMEKGPFFHFLPATKTLALGTAGCNLTCLYCQSWQFAQRRPEQTDNESLPPDDLVAQVQKYGLPSITFTYSEPMIAVEYLADTAKAARQAGIATAMHTAAGCNPEPLKDICGLVDAVNIDIKSYSRSFYDDVVGCSIDVMLDNIKLVAQLPVWLELTFLAVPGYNTDLAVFKSMCQWIAYTAGPNVPLHISRFFPAYRLRNVPATSLDTLKDLRKTAFDAGLRYVYFGNLAGDPGESTYCPKCGAKVIQRVGYEVSNAGLNLRSGKCTKCGLKIPGLWTAAMAGKSK
jgi:pyruvate formate lyase activating enzyme